MMQRLVRFLAKDGKTYYGDAILPQGISDLAKTKQARVIQGDIFGKHQVTDQVAVSNSFPYLMLDSPVSISKNNVQPFESRAQRGPGVWRPAPTRTSSFL
jgi:hypothetical protein